MPKPSIAVTQVSEWSDGRVRTLQDYLVAEEPLEMRLNGQALNVTMRTPGHELELVAGFLLTEGVIRDRTQITGLRQTRSNIVDTEIEEPCLAHRRNFVLTSSCGVCGKDSIDSVRLRGIRRPNESFRITAGLLCELPQKLRTQQAVFGRTGGLHAAGLFNAQGKLLVLREDVGRHNAVDKVVGWALLAKMLPLCEHVLMVSGRGGFEIVQKALAAGIPTVASVSAPSSLAVQLAREFNQTLIGFLREQRFVIYSAGERISARGTLRSEILRESQLKTDTRTGNRLSAD